MGSRYIYICETFLCSFSTPSFPEGKFLFLCHTISLKQKQHILKNRYPNPQHLFPTTLQTVEMLGNTGLPTGPSQGDQGCFRFSDGISRGFRPDTAAEIQRRKKKTEVPVTEFVVVHRREDHQSKGQWTCNFCGLLNFCVGVSSEQLQAYPRNIMHWQYYAGIYFVG